ncbi:succinate-semialdehyde dehydrogenase [NADP(+)] 1 [bacterium BMS3Abin03]|nr:succinate-semialdehyde dehydrogenase [NADP(+)] 1 [bacterium BMS3Abin03]
MLKSINPFTEELIKEYSEMSSEEIGKILSGADDAFRQWQTVDFAERAALMKEASAVLRRRKDEFAKLMTEEMGKPIAQSVAEVKKCAWVCDYYAENAEKFLADELIETDAAKSFVSYRPLGIVLAIMPWNFPFWQVFRFAAPGLMAGNAGVLKHSSNVSGCALAIEDVFREAGFPVNLFSTILLPSAKMREVIENPLVKAVTLTGSVPAGKSVAANAGAVLKKTVLELGGSDPYVILEDADIEQASGTCVTSRLINGGQSCIAAKRFVVVEAVYDKFVNLFVEKMKQVKMGDPFNDENLLGPQASPALRDILHQQVIKSIKMGAKLLLGGEVPDMKGAFYPPTVLVDVKKGMPAYDEELFGPVAAIIKAEDETGAVRIANDTIFGLGAAVFTKDVKRGERIAKEELKAGACFVNSFVKSDPRLPFGGIKKSGYGRELSVFGIREFVNIKTVYVC